MLWFSTWIWFHLKNVKPVSLRSIKRYKTKFINEYSDHHHRVKSNALNHLWPTSLTLWGPANPSRNEKIGHQFVCSIVCLTIITKQYPDRITYYRWTNNFANVSFVRWTPLSMNKLRARNRSQELQPGLNPTCSKGLALWMDEILLYINLQVVHTISQ